MVTWTIAAVVVGLATLGLSRLRPAAPEVDKSNLWIGQVERGPMLREVRGSGTLVPVDINWIAAANDARVASILTLAGSSVRPDTVIMDLSNPEQLQREADAKFQLVAAEADYASLKSHLESDRLNEEAAVAQLKAEYEQAKLRADADDEMSKRGVLPEISRRVSRNAADELATRYKLAQQRLTVDRGGIDAQLAAQRAKVDQYRTQYQLQQGQVGLLRVRAGIAGVLQQVNAEVGQRVAAGTILAKVVQPAHLKAAVKIAETQAKDIQLGEKASVDTRNGVVEGHVIRIDPAAENGTVTVDIGLDGPLPKGARPDLNVDGTIELERLANVLYVQRPVHADEEQNGTVFRLDPGGATAQRVSVRFGRSSVNAIQITAGLKEGDRIILSDVSQWDKYDRIRLQ
ncbi:MAG TPA: HlyD family efflux transporter periplasmic adaptor subunit [Thermoanaerobaculia bacterium]|nr:HlyD family efflux transporter periplasmic adaptor subunit [Thermoanaerobaculia bacterium]